jgi:hypothetical protein
VIAIAWLLVSAALGVAGAWIGSLWWSRAERRLASKRRRELLRRIESDRGFVVGAWSPQALRDLADLGEAGLVGIHATAITTDKGQERLKREKWHGIR